MHNFKELIIWQKARKLVKQVYKTTSSFPSDEKFGLVSQMRRASISIPSNIAEGSGRGTNADFNRFLDMAQGSAFELETQVYLSLDLEFISENQENLLVERVQEIQKMIGALQRSLN
ncbi:MAG: four helix bundle protein [Bacteroidales bacterium]|nr:four helix bundle protein [Bacteroidales bacterium]MCF8455686.1 four helix bundle protein [Bacteroidales bacterium]